MKQNVFWDTDGLIGQFAERYGVAKGGTVYRTVMPGVLADFQKQARALKPGGAARETYRIDDGSAAIEMSAEKSMQGELHIKARLS